MKEKQAYVENRHGCGFLADFKRKSISISLLSEKTASDIRRKYINREYDDSSCIDAIIEAVTTRFTDDKEKKQAETFLREFINFYEQSILHTIDSELEGYRIINDDIFSGFSVSENNFSLDYTGKSGKFDLNFFGKLSVTMGGNGKVLKPDPPFKNLIGNKHGKYSCHTAGTVFFSLNIDLNSNLSNSDSISTNTTRGFSSNIKKGWCSNRKLNSLMTKRETFSDANSIDQFFSDEKAAELLKGLQNKECCFIIFPEDADAIIKAKKNSSGEFSEDQCSDLSDLEESFIIKEESSFFQDLIRNSLSFKLFGAEKETGNIKINGGSLLKYAKENIDHIIQSILKPPAKKEEYTKAYKDALPSLESSTMPDSSKLEEIFLYSLKSILLDAFGYQTKKNNAFLDELLQFFANGGYTQNLNDSYKELVNQSPYIEKNRMVKFSNIDANDANGKDSFDRFFSIDIDSEKVYYCCKNKSGIQIASTSFGDGPFKIEGTVEAIYEISPNKKTSTDSKDKSATHKIQLLGYATSNKDIFNILSNNYDTHKEPILTPIVTVPISSSAVTITPVDISNVKTRKKLLIFIKNNKKKLAVLAVLLLVGGAAACFFTFGAALAPVAAAIGLSSLPVVAQIGILSVATSIVAASLSSLIINLKKHWKKILVGVVAVTITTAIAATCIFTFGGGLVAAAGVIGLASLPALSQGVTLFGGTALGTLGLLWFSAKVKSFFCSKSEQKRKLKNKMRQTNEEANKGFSKVEKNIKEKEKNQLERKNKELDGRGIPTLGDIE